MSTLVNYIRQQNRHGKLLWLRDLYKYPVNLFRFHSKARFINFWRYVSAMIRGYVPVKRNPWLHDPKFYILKKGKIILKIPKLSHHAGVQLAEYARKHFDEYQQALSKLGELDKLGCHFPAVYEVYPDGSYTSAFIDGINLRKLRDCLRANQPLPAEVNSADLAKAIDELSSHIEGYQENNIRWMLQNVLYSPLQQRLYFVSLHNITTARTTTLQTVDYFTAELDYIKALLLTQDSETAQDIKLRKVLHTLGYVTTNDVAYNGESYSIGYHSLTIGGRYFRGQRECSERLKTIPLDFKGKTVLDLGCNSGGILHTLAGEIKQGYGIDWDSKCINAANLIKTSNHSNNLHFYTHDLDRDHLSMIENYTLDQKVDVAFLLSVCAWIKNWRNVIDFVAQIAPTLVFEANGSEAQQQQQLSRLRQQYKSVEKLTEKSVDDHSFHDRVLYLCSNA